MLLLADIKDACLDMSLIERIFSKKKLQKVKRKYAHILDSTGVIANSRKKEYKKRRSLAQKKVELAVQRLKWLKFLPWIRFVGITGSIAYNSAQEGDDIDLFFVTSKSRLWLSRGVILVISGLFGWGRRVSQKDNKDKFCFNFWITEQNLNLQSKPKHDFLSALEIIMITPLFNPRFKQQIMEENKWISQFFPKFVSNYSEFNEEFIKLKNNNFIKCIFGKSIRVPIISNFGDLLDLMAMRLQVLYMKLLKHPVHESHIERDKAKFAPEKYWDQTKKRLDKLIKQYEISS
jgi:hypothetical protein